MWFTGCSWQPLLSLKQERNSHLHPSGSQKHGEEAKEAQSGGAAWEPILVLLLRVAASQWITAGD